MKNEDEGNSNIIAQKLKVIKNILENISEILMLLKPLIEKVLLLEEAKDYRKSETFERAAMLFGDISVQCKELGSFPFSKDFLNNLKN
ncbi:MAG: hypothetical protein ACFFAN_21315 [Promethearchaeota archaeon]